MRGLKLRFRRSSDDHARSALDGLRQRLARFRDDRRGIGAVEFALLFPILLFAYLAAFEFTIGFSVMKRATAAASSVADLVSQQKQDVDKAFMVRMNQFAAATFAPYSSSGLELIISGIAVDNNGNATISWSWKNDNTAPYGKGSPVSIGAFAQANTFLIHAELSIEHDILTYIPGWNLTGWTFDRDYYFRQREGEDGIACKDC